jgi:hypothetical protein
MNKPKWVILVLALAMIGGTATALKRLKAGQHLGKPGIKTSPIAGSSRLDIYLPYLVLDYYSQKSGDTNILVGLPQDTSLAQRSYLSGDGRQIILNAVLMGTDRTCMHNPEFCLPGAGWNINRAESMDDVVPISRPQPYSLPVSKLMTTQEFVSNGETKIRRGVYVYWYVADKELAGTRKEMLWKSATHLLRTGELQRWAFMFCFSPCSPGEEQATSDRMKRFLAASVPEFQLVPAPDGVHRELSQAASQ